MIIMNNDIFLSTPGLFIKKPADSISTFNFMRATPGNDLDAPV